MHRPEPYGSAESRRLYPLIVQEGFVVSIDGSPVSDVVFCDFRGRRSRVQQIGGDATCQGRAVQRAQVSLRLSKDTMNTWTMQPIHTCSMRACTVRQKHRPESAVVKSVSFNTIGHTHNTILPIYSTNITNNAFIPYGREERLNIDLMHVFHSSLCRLCLHVSA